MTTDPEADPFYIAPSQDGLAVEPGERIRPQVAVIGGRLGMLSVSAVLAALSMWACGAFLDTESVVGASLAGVLAVCAVLAGMGLVVDVGLRLPPLARTVRRAAWLRRTRRALDLSRFGGGWRDGGLRVHALPGQRPVAAVAPRGRRGCSVEARPVTLAGLSIGRERSGRLVVGGDPGRAPRVLQGGAGDALSSLLADGVRVEDGRLFGSCHARALGSLLTRIAALTDPESAPSGQRGPTPSTAVTVRAPLPVGPLVAALRRDGLRSMALLGAAFGIVVLQADCDAAITDAGVTTAEQNTAWLRAVLGVVLGLPLIAWWRASPWRLAKASKDFVWRLDAARRLRRVGLLLARVDGQHRAYAAGDPGRSLPLMPAGWGQWRIAGRLPGLYGTRVGPVDVDSSVPGLRVVGDRPRAVAGLTPAARALVEPLAAAGGWVEDGWPRGLDDAERLVALVLPHAAQLEAGGPLAPSRPIPPLTARMLSDPELVWRLACLDAALDADPEARSATLGIAAQSDHPELRLAAGILCDPSEEAAGIPSTEPARLLAEAEAEAEPRDVVAALAGLARRRPDSNMACLAELGDACPAARRAVVGAFALADDPCEPALARWLDPIDPPLTIAIAEVLAERGGQAALPALAVARRRAAEGDDPLGVVAALKRADSAIRARAFGGSAGGLAFTAEGQGGLALVDAEGGGLALAAEGEDPDEPTRR